ncbi:hypothetical protein JTB14_036619 [Gonioctena quinquepunctata]|nr:hypothetical protein JTB14_036619 [Gonioctena quinquepunctata]
MFHKTGRDCCHCYILYFGNMFHITGRCGWHYCYKENVCLQIFNIYVLYIGKMFHQTVKKLFETVLLEDGKADYM